MLLPIVTKMAWRGVALLGWGGGGGGDRLEEAICKEITLEMN